MAKPKQTVIILEPPWWRCVDNGTEFKSGPNKPPRCPVCGSTNIEMVPEVDPAFTQRSKGRQQEMTDG